MAKIKYQDIPKFTEPGGYCVNVDLTEVVHHIDRYKNKFRLQINPDFQRGHVWNEYQQVKFIEFLLRKGRSGRDLYFNCAGWLGRTNVKESPMVLVDGLQRLTSALRFINNEIKVFGYYFDDYDLISCDIGFIFHINNLKTRKEVLQWYIELNEGGVVHTTEEIERVKKLLEKE